MKKYIYSIIFISGLLIIIAAAPKSSGPPGCHANEMPNKYNCTTCHNDYPLNSGLANITFEVEGLDTGYIPGQNYKINISIQKSNLLAAGFQFIALQDNDFNTSPGTITLTQPSRTQKVDDKNPHLHVCKLMQKVWVEHTYDGHLNETEGQNSWSFNWKAPENSVGDITFYLAVLESDFNGEESGDYVYSKSISVPALTTTSNKSNNESLNDLIIFPNPTNSDINIFVGKNKVDEIDLVDLNGVIIKRYNSFTFSVLGNIVLNMKGVASGVYLLNIKTKYESNIRKIVIY